MSWSPDQYHLYTDHRLRPALDLLSQVDLVSPMIIYDLGCGTGNVTSILSQRWNSAVVTGVDSSEEMLSVAKREHPSIEWQNSAIEEFDPASKPNLIFSNAALHWLDDHETLFPKLISQLRLVVYLLCKCLIIFLLPHMLHFMSWPNPISGWISSVSWCGLLLSTIVNGIMICYRHWSRS
ncbi:methyltransferase domain-containing protein [Sneathiella glossodoripedis]|uniref:methyltransferase domain-containing protein n=1 Tax=Sneathiella glossodoripedis TaxID=418853 RepID=UPI0009FCC42D